MPHLTIEYTDNLANQLQVKELLKKSGQVLSSFQDVYPIGGIRVRAIQLTDYWIADGTEDDAFVHMTLKIGAGRTDKEKKDTCDKLFQMLEDHLQDLYQSRYLALSLELYEFSELGTYKKNNIHKRFR